MAARPVASVEALPEDLRVESRDARVAQAALPQLEIRVSLVLWVGSRLRQMAAAAELADLPIGRRLFPPLLEAQAEWVEVPLAAGCLALLPAAAAVAKIRVVTMELTEPMVDYCCYSSSIDSLTGDTSISLIFQGNLEQYVRAT